MTVLAVCCDVGVTRHRLESAAAIDVKCLFHTDFGQNGLIAGAHVPILQRHYQRSCNRHHFTARYRQSSIPRLSLVLTVQLAVAMMQPVLGKTSTNDGSFFCSATKRSIKTASCDVVML